MNPDATGLTYFCCADDVGCCPTCGAPLLLREDGPYQWDACVRRRRTEAQEGLHRLHDAVQRARVEAYIEEVAGNDPVRRARMEAYVDGPARGA